MKKKWILSHCDFDFDFWPKVINFNMIRASVLSNRLAKTASKSVHPFGWNCVQKQRENYTIDMKETRVMIILLYYTENATLKQTNRIVIIRELITLVSGQLKKNTNYFIAILSSKDFCGSVSQPFSTDDYCSEFNIIIKSWIEPSSQVNRGIN